jgi:hypothetical protein
MLSMTVDEEERLIEKLRRIETLFAQTTSPEGRQAAETALDRIRRRLAQLEQSEPSVEFKFALADSWSTALLIALLHRYGLKPYRYPSQRRTTIMVKVARSFIDDVLWPEFQQLNRTLHSHLNAVTTRVIHEAIHRGGDVEERAV